MALIADSEGSRTLIGTLFVVTFIFSLQINAEQQTIWSAVDFHALSDDRAANGLPFEISGLVTFVNTRGRFILADATGAVAVDSKDLRTPPVDLGDLVNVRGTTALSKIGEKLAYWQNIRHLGKGTLPAPVEINGQQLRSGKLNYRRIHARGIISDAFRDGIDSVTSIFILQSDSDSLVLALRDSAFTEDRLVAYVGAEVEIHGVCNPLTGGRPFMTPYVELASEADISVVSPPLANINQVPPLETSGRRLPDMLRTSGRRRTSGFVRATWQGTEMLVETEDGKDILASLAHGQSVPPVFNSLNLIGFPKSDNFNICLKDCLYRTTTGSSPDTKPPTNATGRDLMVDKLGQHSINNLYQNKLVKISGIITSLPSANDTTCRFGLESDGFTIPVDVSSNPDILSRVTIGYRVQVTGYCILQPTPPLHHACIQQINGIFIVPRTAADVRILSRPPWLTVQRLLIVIGSLLAIIVGIFIRNRRLNRIIERRSRELMREEIAHARADLKVEERTRLAVELHDTLSQNITGVALQIDAAQTAAEKDPASVLPYLEVTQRKMQNCRENLRNCLWDLRSRAFEEENLGDAIRKTIAHHLGKSQADIDCDIPCRGLSDNTIHAVLCIIRELTVNAIRHGKAAQISISGKQTDERLSFVVRDNGCGFDPSTRPGMSDGHFGLQGIDERIRRLDGTWQIDSKPGCGCTVTIENLLATS